MSEYLCRNMEVDETRLILVQTPNEAVERALAIDVLTDLDEFMTYADQILMF